MVSAVAGAVQTASGIGLLGGDQAEPGRAEGSAEIAVGRNVDRQAERGGDRLQPVARARAAADGGDAGQRRAGRAQRLEAVAEGEGDAFEHRLRQHGAARIHGQGR